MNVWIIQIGEQLPIGNDIRKMRTLFLAEKLSGKGHSVIWWASAFNHLRKKWNFENDTDFQLGINFQIKALKGIGYKKNNSLLRFIDHRIISKKFKKKIQTEIIPDVIIASIPSYDLAFEATRYALKNKIPIIIDVRDKWPDNFLEFFPKSFHFLLRPFLYLEFKMLNFSLINAEAIVSMSESMLNWALEKSKRIKSSQDKIFHLGFSSFNRSLISLSKPQNITNEDTADKFIVLFIGTFGTYHNPEILIDCAKIINNDKILFILAGDGPLKSQLYFKARTLKNVIFTGWVEQEQIDYLLGISSIGICPTSKDGEKSFFPNKVFLYWSAGLPVGSAFEGEISEVITKGNIGFNFSNTSELVTGINKLFIDKKHFSDVSSNVKQLFKENYDADVIYEAYACFIENLNYKNKC
jgi:glycosyltransferase involved in cell wall biosynthesis